MMKLSAMGRNCMPLYNLKCIQWSKAAGHSQGGKNVALLSFSFPGEDRAWDDKVAHHLRSGREREVGGLRERSLAWYAAQQGADLEPQP